MDRVAFAVPRDLQSIVIMQAYDEEGERYEERSFVDREAAYEHGWQLLSHVVMELSHRLDWQIELYRGLRAARHDS